METGKLLYTIPFWSKEFEITLEVKPKGTVSSGWSHIVRFRGLPGVCCSAGVRQPLLFFITGTTKIGFRMNSDTYNDYHYYQSNTSLQLNEFHTIKVTQKLKTDGSGEYRVTLTINGIVEDDYSYSNSRSYTDVKVYASERVAADADIRNLCFYNL